MPIDPALLARLRSLSLSSAAHLSTPTDLRLFLLSPTPNKRPLDRVIAWLLACGAISPPLRDLSTLYSKYSSILTSHASNLSNPAIPIRTSESALIRGDMVRIINWFEAECRKVSIESKLMANADERVTRVLALLPVNPPYLQGYDRYALVCYALLLRAAQGNGLGADFAEAIAYTLTYEILKIADMKQFLDVKGVNENFRALDMEMAAVAPEIVGPLQKMGINSTHFGLRWEMLLFADEHEMTETWLLWDAIIAHRGNASAFVTKLCVAHLLQVPFGVFGTPIEDVQKNRKWDVPALVRDAEERLVVVVDSKKEQSKLVRVYNIAVAIIMALVMFWLLHGRFKDTEGLR
jgi:hypothetical protein